MVGHDITKGDALFSPYRYRGQLYSIIYGQAIPSVIGQKSVALTADLPAEVLLYSELSEILNDKNTTDKKKLSETKKVIKNLMKLRRQCHG